MADRDFDDPSYPRKAEDPRSAYASVALEFINAARSAVPEPCESDGGWRVRLAQALVGALKGQGRSLGEFAPKDLRHSGGDWMPTLEVHTDSLMFRDGIVRFGSPKPAIEDYSAIEEVAKQAAEHLALLAELRPHLQAQLDEVRRKIVEETSACGAFCIRDLVFEEVRIVPDPNDDAAKPDVILYVDVAYDFGLCDNQVLRETCPVQTTLGKSPNLSILQRRLGRSGCSKAGNCDKPCDF